MVLRARLRGIDRNAVRRLPVRRVLMRSSDRERVRNANDNGRDSKSSDRAGEVDRTLI